MAVIGTAGHVDHGKSTLIQALTGRDPDRWREEKERGLTIDLGFAWTELTPGVEVSFVDVPGHERFMKNMLAGIESVDIALLVVAADEGWMPQTEEHLAVLDLLGVDHAVIALTKCDRVDADTIELARLEVAERLEGTALESAPVVEVSARQGQGLDRLRQLLAEQVEALPSSPQGRPRLWIDRSFSVTGAGTVVTGTLVGGEIRVDDRLTLFPDETEVRVRGIQSHERSLETAPPRQRVALNLGSVEHRRVERGAMLGSPGDFVTSHRVTVTLQTPRYVERLTDRGAYHLHVGSGAWPVRLRLLGDDLAMVELPRPMPLVVGDRFILRESGRKLVMGGGRVVDPAPPTRRAKTAAQAITDLDHPDVIAADLLRIRRRYPLDRLRAESGGGRVDAPVFDGIAYGAELMTRIGKEAIDAVTRYHQDNPLRSGMPTAHLAGLLGVPAAAIQAATDRLVVEGSEIRSTDRHPRRDPGDEERWQAALPVLRQVGLAVPKADDLGLGRELLHALVREGRLIRVSPELVYLPEQIEQVLEVIRSLPSSFTVAEFKDSAGISRKYAVPLLEWTDAHGHTVRTGDVRRFREGGRSG